ncbi:Imm7 family immunity protein [Pasteurella atlantica]|uniref:Imm7 family immunity protein n=1 Tax=Pasteurellaceae TaxID=712 RepID=UPI002743783F|nr:Imm7 family immunity protein [Pasteurella atlantica]MDP8099334.1 Imm7 family immunity protein [Pasteurella atlantica]MDP8107293.1 Imm7 family immunity protein [Pasteurella atlantica]MDP8116984.1 Imm7 family immunity protein [Pasteurella atlantica]
MIEFYGWIKIRESYDEKNESDELLSDIYKKLNTRLSEIQHNNFFIELLFLNGEGRLIFTGESNHKSQSWYDCLSLCEWVTKNAVGSYGVIYFFDDEDTEGYNNQFQIFSIKKGKLSLEADKLLSPFFEELENR